MSEKHRTLGPEDVIQEGDEMWHPAHPEWIPAKNSIGTFVSDFTHFKFRRPIASGEEKADNNFGQVDEARRAEGDAPGVLQNPSPAKAATVQIQPTAASEEGRDDATMMELRANYAESCLRAFTKMCLDALSIPRPALDRDRAKLILAGIQSLTKQVEDLAKLHQSRLDQCDSLRAELEKVKATPMPCSVCYHMFPETILVENTCGQCRADTLQQKLDAAEKERDQLGARWCGLHEENHVQARRINELTKERDAATDELKRTRKLLADANRGAERNATINRSLAGKVVALEGELKKAREALELWRRAEEASEKLSDAIDDAAASGLLSDPTTSTHIASLSNASTAAWDAARSALKLEAGK